VRASFEARFPSLYWLARLPFRPVLSLAGGELSVWQTFLRGVALSVVSFYLGVFMTMMTTLGNAAPQPKTSILIRMWETANVTVILYFFAFVIATLVGVCRASLRVGRERRDAARG